MAIDYSVNPAALEFIFEYTKDAPAKQTSQIDSLDSKAIQVFGAASIVLGLAGLGTVRDASWLLLIGSLIAYLVVCAATFIAVVPRRWRTNQYAAWLWDNCYFRPPEEIRHIIVSGVKEIVEANTHALDVKARAIFVALIATGVEVTLLMITVIAAAA